MNERDAGLCVGPNAIVVRAAMLQTTIHGGRNSCRVGWKRGGAGIQKSCNTAHRFGSAAKADAAMNIGSVASKQRRCWQWWRGARGFGVRVRGGFGYPENKVDGP